MQCIHEVVSGNLGLTDVLYQSPACPIRVLDVIYGHSPTLAYSGNDFYQHKTGFSADILGSAMQDAGFVSIKVQAHEESHELVAFGYRPKQV
jgi:hypothetical protein